MSKCTKMQEHNTQVFLNDFAMMQWIREDASEMPEEDFQDVSDLKNEIAKLVRPFDPVPRAGDIRLLSQPEQLTYVALLDWDWNHSLVIPLSHYEEPATDKEMRAENAKEKGLFQQVYQCWNARTLNNILLSKSWLVGKLSEAEIVRLKKMMRYSILGDELTDDIKNLTGMPIYHDKDKRLIYMNEEKELFDSMDAEDMVFENWFSEVEEKTLNENNQPIRFPTPAQVLQAASNENELSGVYQMEGDTAEFVTAIECEGFTTVAAGKKIPLFTWSTTGGELSGIQTVLFRHAKTGIIIGSGLIRQEADCHVVHMLNSIPMEETPDIASPAEIEIILQKV